MQRGAGWIISLKYFSQGRWLEEQEEGRNDTIGDNCGDGSQQQR